MSGPNDLEARIRELEEIVAHQEHLLRELDDTVVRLHGEIDRIESLLQTQQRRLEGLEDGGPGPAAPADERPPHY